MGFRLLRLGKRQITRWGLVRHPQRLDVTMVLLWHSLWGYVGWGGLPKARHEARGQNSAKVTLEVKKRDKLVLS